MNLDKNEYIKGENRLFEIMNIFFQYYKELYGKNNNEKLFNGINDENDSTNRWLELFYEHFEKYKKQLADENVFIEDPEDINIEDHTELYQLLVNNMQLKVSNSLLPLIEYIYDNCNWKETDWAIETIISEY